MDDEFTCDDGQCIDISTRCDQIVDCQDESDEQGCQLVILDKGYKAKVPPFTVVGPPFCLKTFSIQYFECRIQIRN